VRVLIVGGGVAGLTLAATLSRQGRTPLLVEASADPSDAPDGALLLSPGPCRVLAGLGLRQVVGDARRIGRYELRNGIGRVIASVDPPGPADGPGPLVALRRSALVEGLSGACDGVDVRRGTTVEHLDRRDQTVVVGLSDGSTHEVDLVVGADGRRSALRERLAGSVSGFDARWVLWTWWADGDLFEPGVVREHWGLGWFAGVYPVPGGALGAAALPARRAPAAADGAAERTVLAGALARLLAVDTTAGRMVDAAGGYVRQTVGDARAERWVDGRVALCGDASVAFVPTSGLGAAMALREAAALGAELARADARHAGAAAARYEVRCRRPVLAAQRSARLTARIMFAPGVTAAHLRNRLVERVPADLVARRLPLAEP